MARKPRPRKPGSLYGMTPRQKLDILTIRGDGPDACWLVLKGIDADGYSHFQAPGTTETLAHRHAVNAAGVEIPPGHEVDHLCRVRNCVRLDHLDVVPKRENLRRASADYSSPATCRRGHPWADRFPSGSCRACWRERRERLRQQRPVNADAA